MSLYEIQQEVNEIALDMMLRGVRIDGRRMIELDTQIEEAMHDRVILLEEALGRKFTKFNKYGEPTFFRSKKQITELFTALGQKPGINRKTGNDSFDDEILFKISVKTPELQTVCFSIMEYRQLGQMLSNFVRAKRDDDGRMRCSFNTAGPETFRWSSSQNAFWRGCNLQNITTGDRGLTKAKMPNLRTAIIPDEGYILWEPDLAGADAQIVAWESGDENLKQWFSEGVKIHTVTAKEVYGNDAGPDGRREPYYTLAKKARHLWHYAGKARTMASSLGITVAEADRLIKRFEGLNPAIPRWHRQVAEQLKQNPPIITNRFGYRIVVFGRPADELPDMLAWIGQGTIACVINRALINLRHNVVGKGSTELLLNEHDSTVGQTRIEEWSTVKPLIREQFMKVVVPYDDPLIIPPELKTSTHSWGEMEKEAW